MSIRPDAFVLPVPRASARRSSRGFLPAFTLVELLVVMGILVVLTGMIVIAGAAVFKAQKGQNTQGVMSQAMLTANMVAKRSAILPDHRLANFFFVQPHTADVGATPVFDGSKARRMSSCEFFSFLALSLDASGKMIRLVGEDHLKAPQLSAGWSSWTGGGRTWPDAKGNLLVDVFQRNPSQVDIQFKESCPTTVRGIPTAGAPSHILVSGSGGYQLMSLFDGWGHEIVYRSYADPGVLNGGTAYHTNTPTNGQSFTALEGIEGDEQVSPSREDKANGAVRPAVAASSHPYFFSAGSDGRWGAFRDPAVRDALDDAGSARDTDARDNLYSFDREGR